MGKKLDNHEKVEAVLYAEVYGDEAATARFGVSARTLRNYRALAREKGHPLAAIFREYAAALASSGPLASGDGATVTAATLQANMLHALSFGDWLQLQVRQASDLLYAKAEQANPNNPEVLRAINEHIEVLLSHATALTYIDRLFSGECEEDAGATWGTGTHDGQTASA